MKWNLPTIRLNNKEYYLYWCYGSNLNQEQMAYRCPASYPLDRAELPSYELLFRGNARQVGVATVERQVGSSVPGALWAVTEKDFATLDRYEGFPTLYTRGAVKVLTEDNRRIEAVTYWMHADRYPLAVPSREYLTTIYNGYVDFGLDTKRLRMYYDRHIDNVILQQEGIFND